MVCCGVFACGSLPIYFEQVSEQALSMNTVDLVNKLIEGFKSSPRVLVVDDEENFITLFRHTLEHCGCIVDSSTDCETAIDKIEFQSAIGHPYDIIFLDLKIPPFHGPSVLKRAKEIMPKTPVVIVTNYPDSDLVEEALKYGYFGLIQ